MLEIYVDPLACACKRTDSGSIARVICEKHKMVLEGAEKMYNDRVVELEELVLEKREDWHYCGLCKMTYNIDDSKHRTQKKHRTLIVRQFGASPMTLYKSGRCLRV